MARRTVVTALALFAVYVAVARGSLELASIHISSSPVWPPAGLAIAALAILGLRYWPVILAGAITSNALVSGDWSSSIFIGGGNAGEALVGGWLVRKLGNSALLDRMESVMLFVVAAAAAALVSASVGVASLVVFGLAPSSAALSIAVTWWLGNVSGSLLIVPAALLIAQRGLLKEDALGLVLGLIAGLAAFATTGITLLILLPAAFIPLVVRQGSAVAATLVGLAAGSVIATLQGSGPFWGRDSNEALLLLQVFLVVFTTSVWVLAAGRRTRPTQASMKVAVASISLALAPLLIGAALIGLTLHPALVDLDERRQEEQHSEVVRAWTSLIEEQGQQMAAVRALFEASDHVSQDDFRHFVEAAGFEFGPGKATAIGYAPLLEHSKRSEFESLLQNDTELPAIVASTFSVFPPTNNSVHAPIQFVYPLDPSPGAIGFDLFVDDERKQALLESAELDQPVATQPVLIVKPEGDEFGFMIGLPVGSAGEVIGFVVTAQVAPGPDTAPAHSSGTVYRVVDATDGDEVLFASGDGEWSKQVPVAAWGRDWRLEFAAASLATAPEKATPWFVLAATGILSVAVGLVVYAYDTTRDRALGLSQQMVQQARVDAKRVSEIKRLESLDAFRSRFLNMVAHELRTPLTPIRTQAHVLGKHVDSDRGKRSLAILGRGVVRLSAVVDDLLIAAKANAGELALNRRTVDMGAIAKEAAEAHMDSANMVGTTLTIKTEPVFTVGDPVRLAQIVDNLLTNALKFAPRGNVEVIVKDDSGEARLVVRDDGMGIAAESLDKLGHPFTQVPNGGTHPDQGTGLGLYICKTLARLHEGRLELHSDGLGHGTEARLILPKADPPQVAGEEE